MHTKLAEQAEVHVADQPVAPGVEEMLAEGLDAVEASSVDQRGVGGEPTLWRRYGDTCLPRSILE